ncbi:hypothetical protein B0H16DRAFT_1750084 [Mycena metata]|uniref:CxC2-like cysteine cluster KDZ transposase-associated domain-containing protein n=1 Tax=Mycena metata TaxID=1033252 RepID=A0AAD7DSK1_9AGAR|nr:hypothetical protein B0H16DRAFT_1750084 [Mycena metata]
MSWLNLSTIRQPNRSQSNNNGMFEYEVRPSEISHDLGFDMSQDGRRGVRTAVNVGLKKQKIQPSDWVSLPGDGQDVPDEEGVEVDAESGQKRPRFESSDDPMAPWMRLKQPFLDEMARRHGLADSMDQNACECCKGAFTRQSPRFCCADCGTVVHCCGCLLERHQCLPLHRIKEWNGSFWAPTTLNKQGLVYQLGHGGLPCKRPPPAICTMVVIGTEAIHTVSYRFCGCDRADRVNNLEQLMCAEWYPAMTVDPATCAMFSALDSYRMLNVVGNINVHNFVGSLERRTDPCLVEKIPDRYKAFGRMARQYSFLISLLRAGCAHNPNGLAHTNTGECAVLCWPCPHDGKNLPDGWRDVAPEFRSLYMLLVAMDANFRLKNQLRANEHDDLPLGPGWGYQVEPGPYKEHLKTYVAEKDVSTCITFTALLQKDMCMTTGAGDLQKGERYSNMDYIFLSALMGITAMYLAISYNITCQWKVNLPSRMKKMPERLRLDLLTITLLFALPVWHAATHEGACQTENSLTYQVGVGWTDGEGIERVWSVLNPISWATKEMGVGPHHDVIKDKLDHHNWEKNIGQGTTLPHKLIIAIDERDRQVAAFKDVDSMLRSEVRKQWQKRIDDWWADRTLPNPYQHKDDSRDGESEAAIHLMLTKDEVEEAATGGSKLQGSSVTSFLVAGLQLEAAQQRICTEARGRALLAGDQQERIQEMRIAFFSKLARFRKLQAVYMPAAVTKLQEEEDARDPDLPPPKAEDVKIYLPSGLRAAQREGGCRKGLPAMEGRLREGQCCDALKDLRGRLHTKKHLLLHRETQIAGQRAATRSYTLIEWVGERVDAAAGESASERYRELKPSDIQLDEEHDVNVQAYLGY